MARIVTNDYRYKRPKRKRKPVPLGVPAVVRRGRKREDGPKPATQLAPANDDVRTDQHPASGKRTKPAIVTTTSRKQSKLRRAEQRAAANDQREIDPEVLALFDRMFRPRER